MTTAKSKFKDRKRRKLRVRKKIRGTAARPRLSVFRSLRHLSVQFIDDEKGDVLGAISTFSPRFKEKYQETGKTVAAAQKLGEEAAVRAQELKISEVIFDRGAYRYHGRVKALAEAARKAGLKF